VELVRQTVTEAVVKIEWNKTCLQHGDPKVAKHVLKKLKWNPTAKDSWKTNGAWCHRPWYWREIYPDYGASR